MKYLLHFAIMTLMSAIGLLETAVAQETPIVPNLWDPKAVHDRPAGVSEKIQFLASDNFPPFVFRDGAGRLTGFNVDLARAICQELGSSCSLRIKEFDALLPALEAEEGDAIISGIARTEELSARLLFSDDYLKLPARFMIRTGEVGNFYEDAIAGQRISVEEGSRHAAFARRFWPDAVLLPYDTVSAARLAVEDGTADAHFGDGLALSFWMRGEAAKKCCQFSGGPWIEPGFFDQGLSIATRKNDGELREAINHALRRLYQTGVYRELYLRYFPLSFF